MRPSLIDPQGGMLSPEAEEAMMAYLALLSKWSKAYNLTAITAPDQMITHHLLDSLSIAPWITGTRILDVGTGAGLPGIPLAIYYPEKSFVLLDSIGKKTRFLTQVARELGLQNVQVVQSRIEDYETENAFAMIVSRAVMAASKLLTQIRGVSDQHTRILMMKGSYPHHELDALTVPYVVEPLTVPGLTAERHALILQGSL